ncbi:TetR/AcrR family transcriptional regulator [Leifsonia poae]|uniref:TetR/AcrR family transcriptional regulator n=1 Tax=Leifsonia poae TaxID=110933 RepID=UPI003D666518
MPKVTEAYREARRNQILDAAVACFVRNGIHASTMADVIAESGLSSGAIYDYYGSKQELVLAAVRREGAGRAAAIDAAGQDAPIPPSGVLRILDDAFLRQPNAPTIVLQLWSEAATDPAFAEIANSAFGELSRAFRRPLVHWAREHYGLDDDAATEWAERLLPTMVALSQGLVVQKTIVPGFDRERYFAGIDQLFDQRVTSPDPAGSRY